ncbi:MAG TPA: transporter substrate-binding domain-containing protein [Rhodocyclaceae bacterium]|nr:transporter substrate-binding domain-containing protein [Rhodocyclaceae bacterium]
MKTERRTFLAGLGACLLAAALPARATGDLELAQPGRLRIAVYNDLPPYSDKGRGIDVAIGEALATRLGLGAEIVGFKADDDMNDDLRNMVWKGHYLGTRPADVMLHVPADPYLAEQNRQVRIFAPYHVETVAVIRNPARVPAMMGSAAKALEVFTREKIGVETRSLPDTFLLSVLNGRLRENVVHFGSVAEAMAALKRGDIAAVMASRAEIEASRGDLTAFPLEPVAMPELRIASWPLGMAVKADHPALADALQTALADLRRDGTLAGIFARHGVTHLAPKE